MRRLRRYRRQYRVRYFLGLVILLFLIIIIPALLIRSCTFPFRRTPEVPLVNLWREDIGELVTMTLDEYVKGVVAAEMPASFEVEALKAQAVAARTYAFRRIERGETIPDHPEAHLSTDFNSGQAWVSWDDMRERWGLVSYLQFRQKISDAVDDTQGLIAMYDGAPILAVYHSTSGGRTENSEHYWSERIPYLRSVDDPFSNHSPHYYETRSFAAADFMRRMDISPLGTVRVVERYPSGRVKTFEAGNLWFSGREVRQRLGLKSTWFTVESSKEEIVFSVWGFGHGVGLSQYGADGMAKEGYEYRQILEYYYQGVELNKVY